MSASRARRVLVLIILCFTLIAGLAPAAVSAAGPSIPMPAKMAAVGDSITQAASTGGSLGADAPQNSWSTGTSTTVNSHALRLGITATAYNRSVSGAKMTNLATQMGTLASIQPNYLTVLMGGNDLCTDTVAGMTSVANFRAQFSAAMTTLLGNATTTGVSPNTKVLVVSIPDVYQLWNLFKGNFWARFIWSSARICQSLLANPTSTQTADVQRRLAVRQRNMDYNTQLAQVCAAFVNCLFDGNASFNTTFATSDVSGDYFHPSVAGQRKLSAVSWGAGYTFVAEPPPNQAPSASFADECTGLTCTFTDTSTDNDGQIASRVWNVGVDPTEPVVTHTFPANGTYSVSLTVTDNDGDTDTETRSVTVTAEAANEPPTADFSFGCSGLTCTFTDASDDSDGDVVEWSWDFGRDGTSAEPSPMHTFTAAGTYEVALTVTDDDDAPDSVTKSVIVTAPVTTTMRVESLVGGSQSTGKNTWTATVTVNVVDAGNNPVDNATVAASWSVGAGDTCVTAAGTCSMTSDNLNKRKVASVSLSVTGVTHATLAYDSGSSVTQTNVQRPV